MSEFYDIAKMDDIQVSIPKTSHFSIGTSPYYAHQHGLAIDIYHDLSLSNYEVLSPVSGKILISGTSARLVKNIGVNVTKNNNSNILISFIFFLS